VRGFFESQSVARLSKKTTPPLALPRGCSLSSTRERARVRVFSSRKALRLFPKKTATQTPPLHLCFATPFSSHAFRRFASTPHPGPLPVGEYATGRGDAPLAAPRRNPQSPPTPVTTDPSHHQPQSPPTPVTTDPSHHRPQSPPTPVTSDPSHLRPQSPPTPVTTNPSHLRPQSPPTPVTINPSHHQPQSPSTPVTINPSHQQPQSITAALQQAVLLIQ
jgi:hypothetical protein